MLNISLKFKFWYLGQVKLTKSAEMLLGRCYTFPFIHALVIYVLWLHFYRKGCSIAAIGSLLPKVPLEKTYIGFNSLCSIVGAAIIVTGFYGVIWAQSKEEKDEVAKTSMTPLLQEHLDT